MKKFLLIMVVLVIAFLGWGAYLNETPEGKEKGRARDAIKLCWSEQSKKSNSAEQGRFIAGACELMEKEFRAKFGVNP
ncbi:hypothetical protein [Citrobacter freundii]|uniref:hypothetical protein n=1 Tax=Citrobacter freundii TaxID=546 RepID=UPI0016073EA8|nr:hypothetical protein [Citrobacter freundii]QNC76198.1 hypothetical protein F3113_23130 [Citrobacter freundii]QNC95973.1 hypothetical protein F3084_22980 [Citrobacter freundii]QND01119.1 hypothetical protein F3085_23170 [Citrobacter freundii]QSB88261.1 hypothetical protein JW296_12625 [Citrobacter freundii]HAU4420433.1 hypothetical protein [Citrobacter freundii]